MIENLRFYPKDKAMVPLGVQSLVLGLRLLIVELEPGLAKAVQQVDKSIGVLTPPAIQTRCLGDMNMQSSSIPAD